MDLSYEKIVIVMSDHVSNDEDARTIKQKLKGYEVVRLPLGKTQPDNPQQYNSIVENNRDILDKYIDTHYEGWNVDFFITSLFQEDGCSAFPTKSINRYIIVYDLIPLQFPHYYLDDSRGRFQYLSRYREFFKATHYFAISKTVANDISLQLGIPTDKITPIDGSYISRKDLKQVRPKIVAKSDKFILMPTGDDARKNNLRAVTAFEEFNSKSGYAYKLILTSFFGDKTKSELKMQSDHLIFSGNVSEEELTWLYANSELILFLSEYEGLGMPALEAVEFGKPVLCSSIDVFKEISEKAFHYCNHYDVHDISKALQNLLIEKDTLKVDKREYARILKDYSWDITARRTIGIYKDQSKASLAMIKKKKIAVFAPSPSGYSAIGKVVQEQHYMLSRDADVDYYLDDGITDKAKRANIRVNFLPFVADCKNPWAMDEKAFSKYDQVIYHIGNSEYHVASSVKSLAFPDTIILHDTRIKEMFEVVKSQGFITSERYDQEQKLQEAIAREKHINPQELKGTHISSLVNSSRRVIVHSEYAREAVNEVSIYNQEVIRLNLPTPEPYTIYEPEVIENTFVVGYAGVIHEAKGLSIIDQLLAHDFGRRLHIKLFGFSLLEDETKNRLSEHENVEIMLSPSDTRFIHEVETCNLIIGFRPDYHGETSLSTLEALRLGRPVVVNNVGWFKEIPSELVYKVASVDGINDAVAKAMLEDGMELMNQRRDYIAEKHSLPNYVEGVTKGAEV